MNALDYEQFSGHLMLSWRQVEMASYLPHNLPPRISHVPVAGLVVEILFIRNSRKMNKPKDTTHIIACVDRVCGVFLAHQIYT